LDEQPQTLNQALLAAMDTFAQRTCLQVKRGMRFQSISYRRFQTLALRLASFFGHYGLGEGDRVVIIADNCLEWMLAYVACLLSGGVPVPISTSLTPDMLCSIVEDSTASLAVIHDDRQSDILESIVGELRSLETVVAIDQESILGAFPMASILARAIAPEEAEAIRSCAMEVSSQALAALHYTAGKTDRPRGAVFDQAQRLAGMHLLAEWFALGEDDLAFTFAPWSYIPSLDASLHCFLSGMTNVVAESRQATYDNLQQTSPTLGLVTPYALEQFYHVVMDRINHLPESSRQVFYWALSTSREFHAAGLAASPELREQYARADMTFFSQIRGWLGGRLRRLYSVGAPLSQDLTVFVEAMGLVVYNIYNITEAGGFPAVNQPDKRRADSCGQVGPGFQVRIADDGEILVRGQTVMREYWGLPEDTQEVLDADGWLHTGDLGSFDRDGYLFLTGRKQPFIVLSTGRKVVPTVIEEALVASPYIDQAAVLGDGQVYVSALIVPNLPAITEHFVEHEEAEIGELTTKSPQARELLDKVIDEVNQRVARWEWIRRYALLDDVLFENGEGPPVVTKSVRESIAQRFADQIQSLYPTPIRLADRTVSQVNIEPEQLRELLEKQDILDAWMQDAGIGFLFDLARAEQIDGPAMVNICDAAVAIAQMQNEEKPLSTALIVGDPARIARILPGSPIQLQRYDHIRRMRQVVVALAKMVDGLVLGYGVDKHGYVRGIHKLDITLEPPCSLLLGPLFRHHAAISRHCDAVVFFVPPGGRQVRVFADGRPVGRYANGQWARESFSDIDQAVIQLAKQREYRQPLLESVLRCAFRMSEQNLGAIFIIGKADDILRRSDVPELDSVATIVGANVEHLSEQELINFAKQDGATIVDTEGRFRGCKVYLRPAATTEAEIGLGKGARHSSAAKTSAEAQCLAITVSQDGPITVYDCGRRVLSL
jgi:long-chain acyl-CoA synthetase